MNEQSYKSLVLRKSHAFSRNQTPIISYLSCIVSNNKQKKNQNTAVIHLILCSR